MTEESENYILRSFRFPLEQIDFLKTRRNASQWVRQAIEEKRLRESELPGEAKINLFKRKQMLEGKIAAAREEMKLILGALKISEKQQEFEENKQILDSMGTKDGLQLLDVRLEKKRINPQRGPSKEIMYFCYAAYEEPCELLAAQFAALMEKFQSEIGPEYNNLIWDRQQGLSEFFKNIKDHFGYSTVQEYASIIKDAGVEDIESRLLEIFTPIFQRRIEMYVSDLENDLKKSMEQSSVLKEAYNLKIQALVAKRDEVLDQLMKP